MLLGQFERAEARDAGDRQLHARLPDHQAGMHDLVRGLALVDAAQDLVRAGLQAEIDHLEAELVQHVQVLLLFYQDGRGRAVTRHPLAFGEHLPDIAQDLRHVLRAAHKRVAVRQEDAIHTAVHAPRLIKIPLDLLQLTHAELLFLIHIAECAFVVAAADRDLHDQTICLRRRPEYAALVFDHILFAPLP